MITNLISLFWHRCHCPYSTDTHKKGKTEKKEGKQEKRERKGEKKKGRKEEKKEREILRGLNSLIVTKLLNADMDSNSYY